MGGRFDQVGVQRSLGQELHRAEIPRGRLEHLDEHPADRPPFFLGVDDPSKLREEAPCGVDALDLDVKGTIERVQHRGRLVLAQEPVVHEQTVEPVADRPVDQEGRHRRVHPAAQPRHDATVAHAGPDRRDRFLDERTHPPAAGAPADVVQEIAQDVLPALRVHDLRVELDGVEPPPRVGHGGAGGVRARGRPFETARDFDHFVPVTHPDPLDSGLAGEQAGRAQHAQLRRPELPLRRADDLATELVRHELHAVADSQDRQPQPVHRRVQARSPRNIDGLGAARKDQTAGAPHPLDRRIERDELAVHVELAHPARDELRILSPEIQDEHRLARAHLSAIFLTPVVRPTSKPGAPHGAPASPARSPGPSRPSPSAPDRPSGRTPGRRANHPRELGRPRV